ncbi:type II toxin-antitoxin system RatA family toxin [Ehrlichia ruminantium]|uniref:Type II toxin-antitoxin system RatA family toxin n=1 Tax=Ehrlichia ruminantium TaxID=779 RepID=A0AAE6QBH4_EHRRU|nr:type II toxin-antitoxin system RatA family toxin [Ehrlichia ruminantium]QGR02611.1 type II toxin-antitoxin system RatA family toxin [Ehrlichia ruminantium]QGR03531.1 type II toxin-antitoxin system RatA family toxin [Ehrlichia ruminantium]QGR04458.1 type II toxin-antitoxin system RatA family toxin [Ehrlichia ruminantium]
MSNNQYNLNEEEILSFAAIDLFNIVLDVEKYPDFLPWCRAVYIKEYREKMIVADLLASFKGLSGQYTSYITFSQPTVDQPGWIKVEGGEGLFKFLYNQWTFIPQEENKTLVQFYISCAFKMPMLQSAFNLACDYAYKKIISAFKNRATSLLQK